MITLMENGTFLKDQKYFQDYLTESVKTISQEFIKVINQGGKLIFAGNGAICHRVRWK